MDTLFFTILMLVFYAGIVFVVWFKIMWFLGKVVITVKTKEKDGIEK